MAETRKRNALDYTGLGLGGLAGGAGLNKLANVLENRRERGIVAKNVVQPKVETRKKMGKPMSNSEIAAERLKERKSLIGKQLTAMEDLIDARNNIGRGVAELGVEGGGFRQGSMKILKGVGRLAVIPAGVVGGVALTNAINKRFKKR